MIKIPASVIRYGLRNYKLVNAIHYQGSQTACLSMDGTHIILNDERVHRAYFMVHNTKHVPNPNVTVLDDLLHYYMVFGSNLREALHSFDLDYVIDEVTLGSFVFSKCVWYIVAEYDL